VTHANVGSADVQITQCVCDIDTSCCDNSWSQGCVYIAENDCGACAAAAVCGNGALEAGEQCDDNNLTSGDGCSSGCIIEVATCGNGTLEGNEECDDGNNGASDGCNATCQFEGSACVPRETPGVASESIESCVCSTDSFCCSNAWDSPCVNTAINSCGVNCGDECTPHSGPGSNDPQVTQCVCAADSFCCEVAWDTTCVTVAESSCSACVPPVCGNAILEAGEQCDDGNLSGNDGCSSLCAIENAICGNHAVEVGEECDDGGTGSGDGCSSSCQFEGHACVAHDTPGVASETVEACVCAADSFCCSNAWDPLCVDEAMSLCGVSCGDACSTHNNPGSSSQSVTECVCAIDDYCCDTQWDSVCVSVATNSCAACGGVCGNGVLETGEECDDNNTAADDGCSATCQFEGHECVPRDTPGVADESIESCVCGFDAYCCNVEWDETCVSEANGTCGAGCGNACVSHASPGSDQPAVTSCVCDLDPYCCENSWDLICVISAELSCSLSCAAGS
jgi:cysteine-rich repeat protein